MVNAFPVYKIFLFLYTCILPFTAIAQNDEEESLRRNGFIGLSIGPSFPVGKFAQDHEFAFSSTNPKVGAATGLHLNLLSFGYLFGGGFGMTAKLYGGANSLMINNTIYGENEPWAYSGLLIGPMICFPLSKRAELDFRPMVGYNRTQFPVHRGAGVTIYSKTGLAYDLGANLQFHLGQRIGMHFGLSYFHTKSEFEISGERVEQTISTATPSMGLFYRFD